MELISFAAAAAIAIVCTPVAARLARGLDILDHPGPLKVHERAVPYLGGLAVVVAFAAAGGWRRPAVLMPVVAAVALGLVDDARGLPPRVRLACEVLIGVLSGVLAPVSLGGPLGVIVTAVAVVALINAVNLLDGLDGLASGVALMSALGFAALLDGEARLVALGLAGALAGFLVFNRPPARIYLGDAGAYGLGAALALLLATSWSDGIDASRSIAALPLVAIPLTDTTIAVVRRWRAHRPLFEGDRGHVYDQLVDRGLRPVTATSACVAAQAVLAVAAIAASRLDLLAASALIAACALAVMATAAAGHFLSPNYARSSA